MTKQKFKKTFIFTALFFVLVTTLTLSYRETICAAVDPPICPVYETDVDTSEFYGKQLNQTERKIYDALYEKYYVKRQTGNVPYSIPGCYSVPADKRLVYVTNMISRAAGALVLDYPELGMHGWQSSSTHMSENGVESGVVYLNPYYPECLDELDEALQGLDKYYKMVNDFLPENPSRFDIVTSIAAIICNQNQYSFDSQTVSGEDKDDDGIVHCIGALTMDKYNNMGVCSSYEALFMKLCQYYKVPCIGIAGKENPDDEDYHIWNEVQMDDGQWYFVDSTFLDDLIFSDLDQFCRDYTNIDGLLDPRLEESLMNYLLIGADISTYEVDLYNFSQGTYQTKPFSIPDLAETDYYKGWSIKDDFPKEAEIYLTTTGEQFLVYGKADDFHLEKQESDGFGFSLYPDFEKTTPYECVLKNITVEDNYVMYTNNSYMFFDDTMSYYTDDSLIHLTFTSPFSSETATMDITLKRIPDNWIIENTIYLMLFQNVYQGFYADILDFDSVDFIEFFSEYYETTLTFPKDVLLRLQDHEQMVISFPVNEECQVVQPKKTWFTDDYEDTGVKVYFEAYDDNCHTATITVPANYDAETICYLYTYDEATQEYLFVQDIEVQTDGYIELNNLEDETYYIVSEKIPVPTLFDLIMTQYGLIIILLSIAGLIGLIVGVIVFLKKKRIVSNEQPNP